MLAGLLAGVLIPAAAQADEFLAMPGLWKTTYEIEGASPETREQPRVVWHCVDEQADPWASFAQLQDLPGMTCSRSSFQRNSTSLKWKMQCRGPGPDTVADVIDASGAIVFDSPQHYRGWVKFSGTLLGYPLQSGSKVEGSRKAACTSPSD
ncbi:MAG: hypothetical protein JWO04_3363 [Gammaproteobacteria bacterium]|jgi:hypothetical protein|nr:hypothetical protein [Gammaproteobacteria bacterium]